ncbi:MAG TPA: ATP synthase F1 subunit delta [Mobilitalea sp.]|nr:ATP synthase F1 subunit delta [Mobilitalea sp.]
MITQRALNYAKILYSFGIKEETVDQTKKLLQNCSELTEVLENPVIKKKEKDNVIDALFDKEIASFLKVLCDNKVIGIFSEIMDAYEELVLEHKNMIKAKLIYTEKPEADQLEQIKSMLCNKYNKKGVSLELEEDASLIGGYVLYVGNTEYNKSIKGALSEMQKTLIGR